MFLVISALSRAQKKGVEMAEVRIDNQDDFERALKKFKMQCRKEGIIKKYRERQFYTKPSEKRRLTGKKKKR